MLLHNFPDLRWLKQQADNGFANKRGWDGQLLPHQGWPTVILNATTTHAIRDNIRGPLSFFTNLVGHSAVTAGTGRATVANDFFYLSNHDEHYTLEIDSHTPTETCNIHFGEYFADEVLATYQHRAEHLLDNMFQRPAAHLHFHNALYHRTPMLTGLLHDLKATEGSAATDEKLATIITILLHEEKLLNKAQLALPALKQTTRQEILKRLLRSRDYIYTYLHRDLSLDELAAAACLSKFHFLRLFKIAYGQTPYQFINAERIRRALALLQRTGLAVHEVATAVGFANASAFSRMFHLQTGLYPTALRRHSC